MPKETKEESLTHYYAVHAPKIVGHDFEPKSVGKGGKKNGPGDCTKCGFDEKMHEIAEALTSDHVYDEASKTWTLSKKSAKTANAAS